LPKQQTNKSENQKGELITNRLGSEYNSEYADNDPVIRATIQKFNDEIANEEKNQC
jgi:hypothetical protein